MRIFHGVNLRREIEAEGEVQLAFRRCGRFRQ